MFEWEEGTFLGIKALYKRMVASPRERRVAAVRAELKDRRQALFILAQMMAGRPVSLFETAERHLCDPERIFLPPEISLASRREANEAAYDLKVIVGGLAIRRNWRCDTSAKLRELVAGESDFLPNLPERVRTVEAEFESADELWEWLGTPRATGAVTGDEGVAFDGEELEESSGEGPVTEIEGQGQLDLEVEAEREDDGAGAEMPIHTFEKTETLEEYSGLDRRRDSDDELKDHDEALEQVSMKRVLRSRDRPSSIYRADALFNGALFETDGEPPPGGIPYPEWDYKKRRYKPDWCWVLESVLEEGAPEWAARMERKHRGLVLDLKKKFAHLATEWMRAKRQPAGEDFDLGAVVDYQVAWRSGHTPSENVYLDRHRELHNVSALILLDRSYSTESWVDGRRVLDIIRETIFCTGEVLDEFVDRFAVAAFSSDTRKRCTFHWVKAFEDRWDETRARLGSLQAHGYTRIGPALRHAQEVLDRQEAERRVVILVTDGRPCDYDRYEGTYGIRDVKCAIETGLRHDIATHAFAVESRAREFFPAMFTPGHYHIVPEPGALTVGLFDLFAKLKVK